MAEQFKLSVIVPVYGVERFVERCVHSLMKQTLASGVEFIFVDDASPDSSMDIVRRVVDEYPMRHSTVIYISHGRNLGLPAARNTGMDIARGKYIYLCDSDDFIEPDMLALMLDKAYASDADMVWCDWFLSFGTNERIMRQPQAADGRKALGAMLDGSMKYNVWNKIVRRSLYTDHHIQFPIGYAMGEDMTMIRIAAKTDRVAHVAKPLYHYIKVNAGAMTQQYNDDNLSALRHNVDETISFIRRNISDNNIERELALFCLNVKLPFLFTGNHADIARWKQWYPWADRYIMNNKAQALRTRMLQWCAAHGLSIVNTLYYVLVFKIVYGKLYR